jgi:2-Cys peroxiredoxin 5
MLVTRLSLPLLSILSTSTVFGFVPSSKTFASRTVMFSSPASTASEIKVGDKIPPVDLIELVGDNREQVNIAQLIAGKKVAIFGVPGAFTPGCSKSHLPSFIEAQAALKEKGVEMTICLATNDPFVMEVRTML